jgi:hypothetical protein
MPCTRCRRRGGARRDSGGRAPTVPPNSGSTVTNPGQSDRPAPATSNPRTDYTPPRRMESAPAPAPRNEKTAPVPERPRAPERQRPEESYSSRSYSAPMARSNAGETRTITVAPAPQSRSWQPSFTVREEPRGYSGGNRSNGGGSYSGPSFSAPRSSGSSAPQSPRSSSPGNSRRRN